MQTCSAEMELQECTSLKLLKQNVLHCDQVTEGLIQLKNKISVRNLKVEAEKEARKLLRQEKNQLDNELMKIDLDINNSNALYRQLDTKAHNFQENIDSLMNEFSNLTVEKQLLEEGRNERKDEIKKSFQALVKAMAFHKHYLSCYIDLDRADSDTFSLHFFHQLQEKISDDPNYYVKLYHSKKKWKVLEIKPSIICYEEMSALLENSDDIQGFLTHVRDVFTDMKEKEHTSNVDAS